MTASIWLTQADRSAVFCCCCCCCSEPGRPARRPIRSRSPPAVAVGRHDLELLVEAVGVLDAHLFQVVGGAVAHPLQVELHDVVVLLPVEDPPAQLPVAVVEVEQLRVLLLRLRDGEVDVLAEGGALIRTAAAAAAAVRQAASDRGRGRSGRGNRRRRGRGTGCRRPRPVGASGPVVECDRWYAPASNAATSTRQRPRLVASRIRALPRFGTRDSSRSLVPPGSVPAAGDAFP